LNKSTSGVDDSSRLTSANLKENHNRVASGSSVNQTTIRTPVEDDVENSMASIIMKRNVRVRSPRLADFHFYEEGKEGTDISINDTPSPVNGPKVQRQRSTSGATNKSATEWTQDITVHKRGKSAPEATVECAPVVTMATHWDQAKNTGSTCVTEADDTINLDEETEMSVRPSQPPAFALASVLNQLQDEVLAMKKKAKKYQDHYEKRSPGASREKRMAVKNKIVSLLADIEYRSDQIYNLTDVLEGQKKAAAAAAPMMTEQDVDDTLNSMGLERYGDDDSRFSAAGSNTDLS